MHTVWILVCDLASARLFEVRGNGPSWHVVAAVSHDESRRTAAALEADTSGSASSEKAHVDPNAVAPASSSDVEAEHFARYLAEMLDDAMRSARLHRWVLVAAPHFVKLIRNELSPQLTQHLIATVDQDMSHLYVRELADRLRDTVRVSMGGRDMAPMRTRIDQKYVVG
jgi:protein required for attachment to host cells